MASSVPAEKEDRIVFQSGPRNISVRDVIDAAHFRGETDAFWNGLLARVHAQGEASQSDAELDEMALEQASIAFRYKYDLITAEETEQWLENRGLTLSDFSEYFARAEWAKAHRPNSKPEEIPFVQAPAEERELLTVDLTLEGELDRMATRLAWRVANHESSEAGELGPALIDPERERFWQRAGVQRVEMDAWLGALGRDRDWLDDNLIMEAAYRQQCAKLLTPEARAREISALRLPLTRLDIETIEFDSQDAAREAFLCVRDDGMSMEEVAREGRYPYRGDEMVLEAIPDELQQKFLSLSPGAVLEPMPREDGFLLSRLRGKKEPKIDDADVCARIERRILDRYFSDLTSRWIEWRILFNPPE
ncbi:MAG: hypothetical protein H0T95_02980 [Chthoniobacterales bacterium]|nr:hypothetical protein [Chthoniobacterales bacterium]